MSESAKTSKCTPAEIELLWAIIEQVSSREISRLVDWEAIAKQLGGLKVSAVNKRWSRLNIRLRKESNDGDTGESGAENGDEFEENLEPDMSDQEAIAKEIGGGMILTKDVGDGKINSKVAGGGKVATKKSTRKAPVKSKAMTGKGKGKGKGSVTWDSAKAEIAADAEAEKKQAREDFSSDDEEY